MSVYAYCFMPDHVHLLVQGGSDSFLPDFVHDFKEAVGYEFKGLTGRMSWQRSYHDRILRTYEDLLGVARYIAWNPVRGRLVEEARDWPWLGSFEWERSALVEARRRSATVLSGVWPGPGGVAGYGGSAPRRFRGAGGRWGARIRRSAEAP